MIRIPTTPLGILLHVLQHRRLNPKRKRAAAVDTANGS